MRYLNVEYTQEQCKRDHFVPCLMWRINFFSVTGSLQRFRQTPSNHFPSRSFQADNDLFARRIHDPSISLQGFVSHVGMTSAFSVTGLLLFFLGLYKSDQPVIKNKKIKIFGEYINLKFLLSSVWAAEQAFLTTFVQPLCILFHAPLRCIVTTLNFSDFSVLNERCR